MKKTKKTGLKLDRQTIRQLSKMDGVNGGVITTTTDETWFCKSIDPNQGPC